MWCEPQRPDRAGRTLVKGPLRRFSGRFRAETCREGQGNLSATPGEPLRRGGRTLWLRHSSLRLWAVWDSGMSVPRPWARSKGNGLRNAVAGCASQGQSSLTRCAAILRRRGRFLWLGHSSRRLEAAWDGGGAELRPGTALGRRNSLAFRVTLALGHAAKVKGT